jgi:hypothetical protein
MAEGQGVDVLEDGLRAEDRSVEPDQMRQVWRAEAEKAARYFSALPGFGHPTLGQPTLGQPTEAPVHPAVEPGPSSPEGEERAGRRGFLVRLRQRLGRRPHQPQDPSEQPVAEEPAAAEEAHPRSTRFHTSF